VQNLCVATLQISPAVPTQSARRGVAMQKDRKKPPPPPPPLLGPSPVRREINDIIASGKTRRAVLSSRYVSYVEVKKIMCTSPGTPAQTKNNATCPHKKLNAPCINGIVGIRNLMLDPD
jgi:hypothetical protein